MLRRKKSCQLYFLFIHQIHLFVNYSILTGAYICLKYNCGGIFHLWAPPDWRLVFLQYRFVQYRGKMQLFNIYDCTLNICSRQPLNLGQFKFEKSAYLLRKKQAVTAQGADDLQNFAAFRCSYQQCRNQMLPWSLKSNIIMIKVDKTISVRMHSLLCYGGSQIPFFETKVSLVVTLSFCHSLSLVQLTFSETWKKLQAALVDILSEITLF